MFSNTMVITSQSGVVITTDNKNIALSFWHDGAMVEFKESGLPVFADYVKVESGDPRPVFPVWLSEKEKNKLIAHWEKTGMFSSVVQKIRSVEVTKGIR